MNPLIIKVESKRQKLNLSLTQVAEQVKIPYDRMYKWVKRGTNPKTEDVIKLEAWLSDDPLRQLRIKESDPDDDLGKKVRELDAAVVVLQTKVSQLLADKTGRSSLIELENIKKECQDVQSVRERRNNE